MTDVGPPEQLLAVAAKVDARLDAVLAEERHRWTAVDPRLVEAVDELSRMVTSGGKRLRAAFCYWAWRGVSDAGDESAVIDMGAAFEFLQVFALIHDDIMDDSATRRGTKTVHVANAERLTNLGWRGEARRYGEGVGILVGDLGHVYADRLAGTAAEGQARRLWDDLRVELNLGQYLDMRSAAAGSLDQETARRVATFKSALYTIVRPLQIGACLNGDAPPDLLERLDRFGRPLGRAFQLRDDALGLLGDERQLGKPVGEDLREGKPTELLAFAVANANPDQADALQRVGDNGLTAADVTELVGVLEATGAIEHNECEIVRLVAEARAVLADVTLAEEAKSALDALADFVALRTT